MKTTGCFLSEQDSRHFKHTIKAAPLTTGGTVYQPQDIEDQHKVGICTAIDMTNQAGKVHGKKYSADFHYLLQKKFIDGDWYEGSSILSALKVGYKYGFLPAALFPIGEADRTDYPSYIAKLQAITMADIQKYLSLCENKLTGYAQVSTDTQSIAQALSDSPSGIQCMYLVGQEWWTAPDGTITYDPTKIDPLQSPKVAVSGHSIKATFYDFITTKWLLHANTWGTDYDLQGNCHVGYTPLEAWIPYFNIGNKYIFNTNFGLGTRSIDVKQLQMRLEMSVDNQTGYFGPITLANVIKYQTAHNIIPTGYVGPLTRASLNKL